MRGDGVADCKQMNATAIIASGTRFGDANGTFAPVVHADSAVRGDGARRIRARVVLQGGTETTVAG